MGRPKLHLPFARSTILGTTVAVARRAGCRVIVVGRPGDEFLAGLSADGVLVARNPRPDEGMISTLRAGLGFVLASRFFFLPGDMPLVAPTTWELLLGTYSDGPVIPTFRGRRGHPVLMPSSLIPAILALEAGLPLKVLIT
ncbi:MAG: NTP transferase domain-containing protein, partial [Spirochaetota bacterium]